jgi:hypothetical protein
MWMSNFSDHRQDLRSANRGRLCTKWCGIIRQLREHCKSSITAWISRSDNPECDHAVTHSKLPNGLSRVDLLLKAAQQEKTAWSL